MPGRATGSLAFVFKDRGELSVFEDRSKEITKCVERKLTETYLLEQNGLNVRGDGTQHLVNPGHPEKVPSLPGRMWEGLIHFEVELQRSVGCSCYRALALGFHSTEECLSEKTKINLFTSILQKEPGRGKQSKGGMGSTCPRVLRHPKVAESVLGLQHSFLKSGHRHDPTWSFLNTGAPGPRLDLPESEFPQVSQSKTLRESEESVSPPAGSLTGSGTF